MADTQKIHSEFAELLNSKVEELRSSLSSEMRRKLEATLEPAPGTSPTDQLNSAIDSMQQFTAQADVRPFSSSKATALQVGKGAVLPTRTGSRARISMQPTDWPDARFAIVPPLPPPLKSSMLHS